MVFVISYYYVLLIGVIHDNDDSMYRAMHAAYASRGKTDGSSVHQRVNLPGGRRLRSTLVYMYTDANARSGIAGRVQYRLPARTHAHPHTCCWSMWRRCCSEPDASNPIQSTALHARRATSSWSSWPGWW